VKVLLTGATGFVGGHTLAALAARGHEVTCLVRAPSADRLKASARQVIGDVLGDMLGDVLGDAPGGVPGDATRPRGLAEAMAGMHAVVHLVGIIRELPAKGVTFERLHVEATRNVILAAREAGVRRIVHMSANGARPEAPSRYHRTKWAAEELVRGSGLAYTIFRPSIIFGPGDSFVSLLAGILRRAPVVPVVGDGRYQLQPVAVATVAAGFSLALEKEAALARSFEVGGPDRLTYDAVLDTVAEALGRRPPLKLHLPVAPLRLLARALSRFPWFPLTPDQITMLLAGNTCDAAPFYQTFGLTPVPFSAASLSYLQKA